MISLIMAGGSGTRFWPLSKRDNPKQFLTLFGNKSMIRQTFERCQQLSKNNDIYVVTTDDQASLTRKHIPELREENIIIEPCARNTTACIALATKYLLNMYEAETKIIILPADHYIPDCDKFKETIAESIEQADGKDIIIYGITPNYPATGYGYIVTGEQYTESMFLVKQFTEKPNLDKAIELLSGKEKALWNAGMALSSLGRLLSSFEKHCCSILPLIETTLSATCMLTKISNYSQIDKTPFDISILEKTERLYVFKANFAWSDIGSWASLAKLRANDLDSRGDTVNPISLHSNNNLVMSKKCVALLGVKNLVVVESEDCILVLDESFSERVKELTDIVLSERPDLL
jgi:mannose-1-phosphate guanylyltransferase